MNLGNRALGYPRVSTDEQAEKGYSLPEQEAKIRAHCIARGYPLVDMISDDFTGTMLERPGLNRVTELAQAQGFDVLVCVRLDRLARVNHLRALYEARLQKLGIRVEFVEQSFEGTSSGRLQKNIVGSFDEYEVERIAERTAGGRTEKASKKGVMPIGAAPYGYHQISVAESLVIEAYRGRSGELVILEEEAAVVRHIFALCAEGIPVRTICKMVNAEGFRTRGRGKTASGGIWEHSTVFRLIRNETYVGRRHYGVQECHTTDALTDRGNPRVARRFRDRSEWIPLSCPAIVDEELFLACAEQLQRNREELSGRAPKRSWVLSGIVRCGVCVTGDGRPLSCSNHQVHGLGRSRIYRCNSGRGLRRSYCGTRFPAAALERMALDALRRAAEPSRLAEFARGEAQERQQSAGDPVIALEHVETELAGLDRQEAALLENALASGFSAPVIQSRLEALRRTRADLTRQGVALRGQVATLLDPTEAARRGEIAADRLRSALPAAERDPALLRELMRLFLDVVITPGEEPRIRVLVPPFAR